MEPYHRRLSFFLFLFHLKLYHLCTIRQSKFRYGVRVLNVVEDAARKEDAVGTFGKR